MKGLEKALVGWMVVKAFKKCLAFIYSGFKTEINLMEHWIYFFTKKINKNLY